MVSNIAQTNQDWDIHILRIDSVGAVDSLFAVDGRYRFDVDTFLSSRAYDCVVLTDQSFCILAELSDSLGKLAFGIVKFTPDGLVDTSFAKNGYYTDNLLGYGVFPKSLTNDLSNRLITTGFCFDSILDDAPYVARLLPEGKLDTTFAGTGTILFDFLLGVFPIERNAGSNGTTKPHLSGGIFREISLDDSENILCSGGYSNGTTFEACVVKFQTNGSLDSSFFDNGTLIFNPLPLNDQFFEDIASSSDGAHSILFNHRTNPLPAPTNMNIFHLSNQGNQSFSELPFSPSFERGYDIFLENDTSLWVAGGGFLSENFSPNGLPDSAFLWGMNLDKTDFSWERDASFEENGNLTWHFNQDSIQKAYIKDIEKESDTAFKTFGLAAIQPTAANYSDLVISRFSKSVFSKLNKKIEPAPTVLVFPNPLKGSLLHTQLNGPIHKINTISLFDLFGNKKMEMPVDQNVLKIDMKDLIPGIYFLQIQMNNGYFLSKKIVKL